MSLSPLDLPVLTRLPRLRLVAPTAGPAGDLPAVVRSAPVPTVDGRLVDYAPLDHGASTPAFASVARAVETAGRAYSSVHRGTGWLSRVTSAHYEAARAEIGRFVGARPDDVVVLTRNTTDSLTLLARSLPTGTPVVVLGSEHHASLLPWPAAATTRLPVPTDLDDALASIGGALAALDPRRTGGPQPLLVVAGASNVTGELWPLDRLVGLAHGHGARVVVDAAQLLAHRDLDLGALGADWVAFSGHKLHAPYGTGALVGRADWLDAADPYLPGGGASAAVTADDTAWTTGPARHEGGSPNVLGAVALAAACATIREHRRAIDGHERRLTTRLVDGLRAVAGVRTYSLLGDDADRGPVVTFTVDGLDSHLVAAALSAEHGIGVRAGKFCAHLLVDALLDRGTDGAAERPATAVRVSAGLASTDEHVERLLTAVARLAAHGPDVEYVEDPHRGWVPLDDPRESVVPLPW